MTGEQLVEDADIRAPIYAAARMAAAGPPPGRGRELERERAWEGDDPERAALLEQLTTTRRWAYFATFLAFLGAAGAAVAIAFALQDDGGRSGASRSSVRSLQEDVARLEDQVSSARSSAQDAESSAESLASRVEELEQDVSSAQGPDQSTQRELDGLRQDLDDLQQEVAELRQDGGSGGSSP